MGKGRVILVVDGDEFLRRAIEKYCSDYAPTISVSTVQAAIQALDQDLVAVVLDIHPQEGSGLTVLDRIRKQNPLVPVLIRTDRITSTIAQLAARNRAELLGQHDSTKRLRDFVGRAVSAHRDSQPRLPIATSTAIRQTRPR